MKQGHKAEIQNSPRSGRLLLVDDEPAVRNLLTRFLSRKGYTIETASGFLSARQALTERGDEIDAVISDVMMPDGSGVDLLEVAKSLVPPVPVILLTAHASLDLAISGIRNDVFDLLTKPPDFERLAHVAQHAVEYRRLLFLERKYTLQLEEQVLRKTVELSDHKERLAALASQLSRVEEQERRRFASELHDEVGQTLAFTRIKLGAIPLEGLSRDQQILLAEGIASLEQTIKSVRSLTVKISPPLLYTVGLEVALKALAESFLREHGLAVTVTSEGHVNLGQEERGLLYQTIRELLVNVVKHSGASSAKVSVQSGDSGITVVVVDNGAGFDADLVPPDRFGLFNIRERLLRTGGTIAIESMKGTGTRVSLYLPLKCEERC